jgi:CRISPR-associated protein Csb1
VKNDRVGASKGEHGGAEFGFGNVPYARTEFAAKSITAYFNLDLAQVRSLRLPEPGAELVVALALWKIRRLLSTSLRLRSACDLEPVAESSWRVRPQGVALPSQEDLDALVKQLVGRAVEAGVFTKDPVTKVSFPPPEVKTAEGSKDPKKRGKSK